MGSLKLPSGNYTSNLEETYEHLLEVHFPGCRRREHDMPIERLTEMEVIGVRDLDTREVISTGKLEWAISSFRPFKSQGLDGIFPA